MSKIMSMVMTQYRVRLLKYRMDYVGVRCESGEIGEKRERR